MSAGLTHQEAGTLLLCCSPATQPPLVSILLNSRALAQQGRVECSSCGGARDCAGCFWETRRQLGLASESQAINAMQVGDESSTAGEDARGC